MGFYNNELYEFSFEAPTSWQYDEDLTLPDGTVIQVLLNPEEFNPLFHLDTPLIGVVFENVPESKVPVLNSQELERYSLDSVRTDIPNAKIISSDVESTSWGWIVTTEVLFSKNFELSGIQQMHQKDTIFYFKDRESYDVTFLAFDDEKYYDKYYPVYEHVLDTLVIKGVIVPEFHEIAIMVLGSGIIGIIALSKKFRILKILNS